MHVLFIVKAFNDSYFPISGIFLKEQALAVSKKVEKTSIIAVNFVSWKDIIKHRKFDFGFRKHTEGNLTAYVYQVPVIPFWKRINFFRRDRLLKKLFSRLTNEQGLPDISHSHGFYTGSFALELKTKLKIPYIITEHYSVFARNLVNNFEKKLASKVYKNSDYRIGVSPEFCSFLSKKFDLEFQFLPNIVDVEFFSLKEQSKNKKNLRFISVGSLDENKNHKLIIDSIKELNNNEISLKIIGEGVLKKSLESHVKSLNLENQIEFLGSQTKENIAKQLHESDVFVLASKYETFGVVIIEAMSCGLAIISTKNGGVSQLIDDEKLGYLCNSDIKSMSQSLKKIINKEIDSKYIRNFALDNFSSTKIVEKLLEIYKKTIKNYE